MLIGQQKGRDTREKVRRNFGMPRPEGYRKAQRLMRTAERFGLPVVTFIDTPGAYPGVDAEERGQSRAIAENLYLMSQLRVPILCVVIGEGGSGGALAIGMGDRVLMLRYATYSVISPEGCAAILWKDNSRADAAAQALGITADRLAELGLIDDVVQEPPRRAPRSGRRRRHAGDGHRASSGRAVRDGHRPAPAAAPRAPRRFRCLPGPGSLMPSGCSPD